MDEHLRQLVRQRARGRCEYCLLPDDYSQQLFEVDHIIAVKHRGPTILSNLAWTCFACNNHKGSNIAGICPGTKRIEKLFHPRRHKWPFHFAWHGGELTGKTVIGKTTIVVLEINLPYRIAVREALMDEGVFFD